jgi:hypothetical protein
MSASIKKVLSSAYLNQLMVYQHSLSPRIKRLCGGERLFFVARCLCRFSLKDFLEKPMPVNVAPWRNTQSFFVHETKHDRSKNPFLYPKSHHKNQPEYQEHRLKK